MRLSMLGVFFPWGIVFLLVSTPNVASADPITVGQLTDLMIENQGVNAQLIGRFFGPDGNSPLTFSSNVNFRDFSFQFSLGPMQYLGQTIALTGTGTFDPTTSVLTLSSSGSLGATSWMTIGAEVVTLSPDSLFNASVDLDFLEGGVLVGDTQTTVFERTDGSTGDFAFDTDENREEIKGTTTVSTDTKTSAGNWTFQSTSETALTVNSVGFSPPTGGLGSFTTVVSPEPTSSLLVGFMIVAVVVVRQKRARLTSPRFFSAQ